jgi:vacuolar-type H+-ATPase subunit I/STV1
MTDKTQEIREALNDVDLDAYEDYAFENVMHKSKARICANAPEWLSYLLTELDAAKQENERLNELTEILNATCGEMNRNIETLQQRLKQVEEAIQVAYNIAYENFETVNQMDLIRLTLGDTLSIIRGEAKEGNQ